jgi:hypothetical protein
VLILSLIVWLSEIKKRLQKRQTISSNVETVLMLTNFISHNVIKYYRAKAKGLLIAHITAM